VEELRKQPTSVLHDKVDVVCHQTETVDDDTRDEACVGEKREKYDTVKVRVEDGTTVNAAVGHMVDRARLEHTWRAKGSG